MANCATPPGAIIYPAAERNKDPILQHLKYYLLRDRTPPQILLEIGAGTGQHTAHFASQFPHVTFVPTEIDSRLINSIKAFRDHLNLSNISEPAMLDVTSPPDTWLDGTLTKESIDYVYSANMVHISPLECTKGLFNGASYFLKRGGFLFMYGPFAEDGIIKPQSNVDFDKSLKRQNPEYGLRDIRTMLTPLAQVLGLQLARSYSMPANNKFLVWVKQNYSSNVD